jgi:DNA-binding MarR family transcriptional regulator
MKPDALRRVGPDFLDEFPAGDRSATECYVNLCRASDMLLARLGSNLTREVGISVTALMVLATLEGAGGRLKPSEISERAVLAPSSITSVLDTLEKRGLVARSRNLDDRRSVLIDVTDDGYATLDMALPGIRELERTAFLALSERERATLLRLLGKLMAGLDGDEARAPMPTDHVRHVPSRLGRSQRGH